MKDETIFINTSVGKRLGKIRKKENRCISYNGSEIPLAAKFFLGRSKDSDFVIDDPLASRTHAVIQKIKNSYFVKDLNSTNGTYVNDKEIPKGKYMQLKNNDVVRIGRIELVFY